jgi:hypothetical protein
VCRWGKAAAAMRMGGGWVRAVGAGRVDRHCAGVPGIWRVAAYKGGRFCMSECGLGEPGAMAVKGEGNTVRLTHMWHGGNPPAV